MRSASGAALLFCSILLTNAGTLVTFQVDMSTSGFDPGTQTVAARGSFAGTTWAAFPLTNNPSGPNPSLWSGTTNLPFNDGVLSYKYTIEPGANYETVFLAGTHYRLAVLPASSGSALVLPAVYYGDLPPTPVTVLVAFQLNLAQQINIGAFDTASSVYVRGAFNGWGTDSAMTNDPSILTTNSFGLVSSNVYTMIYEVTGSPGQTTDFKYYIDKGANWESPGPAVGDPVDNNNRFFNLANSTNQVLDPVYFGESPYSPAVTNNVTFQVDLTAQVLNGSFDPLSETVELRGNFNSWGTPQILCTNDLSAANTNIYKAVVRIVDGVNATEQYKFWASFSVNSGWETMANNRSFNLANAASQSLPTVFFSDANPADLLSADTVVTFKVDMTAALTTTGHAFAPDKDQIYINGLPAGAFANWDTFLGLLTNNPLGTRSYSLDVLIPKGSPLKQTYKYGVDDGTNPIDNEAASGNNHVRYIRATGTYAMPLDTFGNQLVEPAFGELKSGHSSSGHVLITWLGGPGIHLQTRASLSAGTWIDHPETDALGSTNLSVIGSDSLFLRLIKP